jgi:hypothetical protein
MCGQNERNYIKNIIYCTVTAPNRSDSTSRSVLIEFGWLRRLIPKNLKVFDLERAHCL